MTSIEEHDKAVKEYIEDIKEKMRLGIIKERQKIIAFSASEAATNVFASMLHKLHLIEDGFHINHQFFSSLSRAEQKFPFDFPQKKKILELLVKQEGFRDKLCYGKEKDDRIVDDAIQNMFEVKKLIEDER
jgi:hypothetical protein